MLVFFGVNELLELNQPKIRLFFIQVNELA